ncbi:MAG TPA: SHOCT domain-containing protein [Sulfuricurvum sp.]|nr:SHOCT domain-containing protein [Sulfuricurvum sp.]HQT37427.1 SHOCT domain-containing protein [Sulfuricurvum sp.]
MKLIILIIIVLSAIVFLVIAYRRTPAMDKMVNTMPKNKNDIINEYINELENFSATLFLADPSFRSGILVDEKRKEILLWKFFENADKWQQSRLHYNDILSVEIIEDGITVTKTNRISQIGGALLGGLLGGAGAVIGGLSGKKETSAGKIKSLELKIIINDTSNPIFIISLLSKTSNGISTEKTEYIDAKSGADHWKAVFEAIIKQADAEEQQAEKHTTVESGSVSDELKKLAELKESGILTEDEFLQQKQKLLNQ